LLCLDDDTYFFFKKNKNEFPKIILFTLNDIEKFDIELLKAKNNRSLVEYYFTLSPILPLFLLNKFNLNHICTIDADLVFYNSPKSIFDLLNYYSIIITPHNFSKELSDRIIYGKFNVSFQIFKNNDIAIKCLNDWRLSCLEWCYDYYDKVNDRFADQKYLDKWPLIYNNDLFILNNINCGLAVWNINNYFFKSININKISLNNIIYYHFHNFKILNSFISINGFHHYHVNKNNIIIINNLYYDYWNKIEFIKNKYGIKNEKLIRYKRVSILKSLFYENTFYIKINKTIYFYNIIYLTKLLKYIKNGKIDKS